MGKAASTARGPVRYSKRVVAFVTWTVTSSRVLAGFRSSEVVVTLEEMTTSPGSCGRCAEQGMVSVDRGAMAAKCASAPQGVLGSRPGAVVLTVTSFAGSGPSL